MSILHANGTHRDEAAGAGWWQLLQIEHKASSLHTNTNNNPTPKDKYDYNYIWVKFLRAYRAWIWCHIFCIFEHLFWQLIGSLCQKLQPFLKIYEPQMVYMPLFGPYQPFVKHHLVRNATGHSFSLNNAIWKVDMVQTEACRPSGAHIFSEKVAIFGIANL